MATTRHLLVDTDCGVDDAVALALALTRDDCVVEAITCCFGNAPLRDVVVNVRKVLWHLGKRVPVFAGCSSPVLPSSASVSAWPGHGSDGLGGLGEPLPADCVALEASEHAACAIVRLAKSLQGRLEVVTLGPLTNLALACQLDPDLPSRIACLTVMGGAYQARGNYGPTSEFNIGADPEAAAVVMTRFPMLTMSPWELFDMAVPWETYDSIFRGEQATPLAQWYCRVMGKFEECTRVPGVGRAVGSYICDAIAVYAALDTRAVLESQELLCTVDLAGALTRGQTVFDWRTETRAIRRPNVRLLIKLDKERYVNALRDVFATFHWCPK